MIDLTVHRLTTSYPSLHSTGSLYSKSADFVVVSELFNKCRLLQILVRLSLIFSMYTEHGAILCAEADCMFSIDSLADAL